ncbi:MAG: Scr1 family TA system antitoxin-like transcriptional regulator [Acidimicrobiales bacterium]
MPSPASPAVSELELTFRIRARRQELGLKAAQVSSKLDFSPNYWSAVENGRTLLAPGKLDQLVELFKFDSTEASELKSLLESAKRSRWWNEYATILDDDLMHLYGLEYGAEWIETYESYFISGLLQTEEYASAVFRAGPEVSATTARQRWEFRKQRQRRLRGTDPLRLTVLMGQAAIMQQFGSPEVLRRQLQSLARAIDDLSDTLKVFIAPFDRPPEGMAGSSTMHLLHFHSPHLPVFAWRESITPIGLIDDPEEVETISVNYDRSLASSLDRAASLSLIEARIGELS